MILITVKTKLTPGGAEEYLAAMQAYSEATRSEPGNKWYEHYVSADDPDTILTSEAFDDKAAGEAHTSSEHFTNHFKDHPTKHLVAETPDIIYVEIPDQDGWGKMAEF